MKIRSEPQLGIWFQCYHELLHHLILLIFVVLRFFTQIFNEPFVASLHQGPRTTGFRFQSITATLHCFLITWRFVPIGASSPLKRSTASKSLEHSSKCHSWMSLSMWRIALLHGGGRFFKDLRIFQTNRQTCWAKHDLSSKTRTMQWRNVYPNPLKIINATHES